MSGGATPTPPTHEASLLPARWEGWGLRATTPKLVSPLEAATRTRQGNTSPERIDAPQEPARTNGERPSGGGSTPSPTSTRQTTSGDCTDTGSTTPTRRDRNKVGSCGEQRRALVRGISPQLGPTSRACHELAAARWAQPGSASRPPQAASRPSSINQVPMAPRTTQGTLRGDTFDPPWPRKPSSARSETQARRRRPDRPRAQVPHKFESCDGNNRSTQDNP